MATRILSFLQLVREADPGYSISSRRPWVYQFSNGRRFYDTDPVYTPYAIGQDGQMQDSDGNFMFDSDGNAMFDASGDGPSSFLLNDQGVIVSDDLGQGTVVT